MAQASSSEPIVRLAAGRIARRIQDFWQWSTLSHGHRNYDQLMASCATGDKGTVSDRATVTELTAYAWVPAAEIYLNCRVFR